MALTAKFQADFSSFYKAVQDATAKLEGFQQEADQVSKSLDRMVDTLSGKRLISQATLMAKAVEEIGGASRLTESELKKVSATVGEAAAKMERMGIAIPKSFTDITEAAEGVNKPTETWGSTLSSVTTIVKGLMALQIVSWMKDAVAAGIEWASAMTTMRAQTDLTYRDLQVLEDVGIETGTALGSLTKSVQVLQERIGDRSARDGIRQLGLSFDAILAMRPADQFVAIATAIGKIEDPTLRAAAAKKVFGNAYRDALPAMRADIDEIAKGTKVIGDKQIEAADRASARWDKFWNDQKKGWAAWAGSLVEGTDQGLRNWEEANRRGAEARANLFGSGGPVVMPGAPGAPGARIGGGPTVNDVIDPTMISQLRVYGRTLDETTAATEARTEATKKAKKEQEDYNTRIDASIENMRLENFQLGQTALQVSNAARGFQLVRSEISMFSRDFSKAMTASTIKADGFGTIIKTSVLPSLGQIGKTNIDLNFDSVADTTSEFFKKDFGKIIVGALQGGGNPAKAALAGFGNSLFSENSKLTQSIGSGVEKVFGKTGMGGAIGGAIGGMVPMIGSLIGPAISGITGLFKKVFGKPENEVSPLRDEFFKMAGGLETLNPKVDRLTGSLALVKGIFDAKNLEQYNVALEKMNALFQAEQDALATLTETAARYGLTLEELGPAMQRQQLDKQAQQLYKDWQVLNAAGIDTTVITARMAEAINKYTNDAIAMAVEVPSAMRPMIEKMIEMGQLTDSSGNKIESLESSGISFAMTMSDGFKALITSVEKLADILSRSLGTAIDSTTKKINAIPDSVDVEVKYRETGAPVQDRNYKVPGYATGTDGFVDFGAGTLAMLHGREAVVPENAVQRIGGGGGGAAPAVSITINAQGAFFDTPGDVQRLADKVNDALTAKYGFTNRNRAA